ncbi:MAG: endolytic transglycosylase MltG [Acidobacteria bacterium]|nr:endolytic transglycosylase MltG [Acidobacteriota bacterium]MBI3662887.1 endolytic transglycosylase MltG [Acidobacteriota bacterium]
MVWLGAEWQTPYQGFPTGGVFVEVSRGMSSSVIARRLAQSGVVRSRVAFDMLSRWKSPAALQAGEYHFDQPVTPMEVFRKLAEGRVFVHVLTVPEGKTIFDVAELVENERLARRKAFLAAASDASLIHDLAPEARSLEGFLFPATYQFPRRVTPERIVETMVKRFREVWGRLQKEKGAVDGRPVAEVVTLASLVEKETGVAEERPLVAGVFHNRLKRRMALQCDPTVIYALELANKYDGSLNGKDLQFKSPYNTYRNAGLPPGPIANPGEASLRAALAPPKVDYLYFVANMEGGHFFSRTLAEHNSNVARYRRLQAQNGRSDAPKAGTHAVPQRNPR